MSRATNSRAGAPTSGESRQTVERVGPTLRAVTPHGLRMDEASKVFELMRVNERDHHVAWHREHCAELHHSDFWSTSSSHGQSEAESTPSPVRRRGLQRMAQVLTAAS